MAKKCWTPSAPRWFTDLGGKFQQVQGCYPSLEQVKVAHRHVFIMFLVTLVAFLMMLSSYLYVRSHDPNYQRPWVFKYVLLYRHRHRHATATAINNPMLTSLFSSTSLVSLLVTLTLSLTYLVASLMHTSNHRLFSLFWTIFALQMILFVTLGISTTDSVNLSAYRCSVEADLPDTDASARLCGAYVVEAIAQVMVSVLIAINYLQVTEELAYNNGRKSLREMHPFSP